MKTSWWAGFGNAGRGSTRRIGLLLLAGLFLILSITPASGNGMPTAWAGLRFTFKYPGEPLEIVRGYMYNSTLSGPIRMIQQPLICTSNECRQSIHVSYGNVSGTSHLPRNLQPKIDVISKCRLRVTFSDGQTRESNDFATFVGNLITQGWDGPNPSVRPFLPLPLERLWDWINDDRYGPEDPLAYLAPGLTEYEVIVTESALEVRPVGVFSSAKSILLSLLLYFILTIVVETGVTGVSVVIFQMPGKTLRLVPLVNLFTWPAAVLCLAYSGLAASAFYYYVFVLQNLDSLGTTAYRSYCLPVPLIEVLVVVAETELLHRLAHRELPRLSAFFLSLAINMASFLVGLVVAPLTVPYVFKLGIF